MNWPNQFWKLPSSFQMLLLRPTTSKNLQEVHEKTKPDICMQIIFLCNEKQNTSCHELCQDIISRHTHFSFTIQNEKLKNLFCLILNSQHFSCWDICKNWDSLDVAYLEIPIGNITTWHTLSTLLSVYERDPPVGKMDFWCFLCR